MEARREFYLKLIDFNNKRATAITQILAKKRERNKLRLKYIKCLHDIKVNIHQYHMLAEAVASLSSGVRLIWKKPRTNFFWEIDCQAQNNEFFREHFRMDRQSFEYLCNLLKGLEKEDTVMRNAIPLRKRVAVALYTLGSTAEYRIISNMFDIGKSTVGSILIQFCEEVWNKLRPIYMNSFPLTEEKIKENVDGFNKIGLPQCFGAIDGCHIEVHPRAEVALDYYNNKGWYSTILLALVDHRHRFVYINVGSPGGCNYYQIYEESLLKKELTECKLLTEMSTVLSNVIVPVYIIGDSEFKLALNLIKPYPFGAEQSLEERVFNYKLSKCRRVVENAFGQLKARFRRVGKRIDNRIENVNAILKACCILHNFLNERKEQIKKSWIQEQETIKRTRESPDQISILHDIDVQAQEIRKAITKNINVNGDEMSDNEAGTGDDSGGGTTNGDGCGEDTINDCGGDELDDGEGCDADIGWVF